MASHRTECGGDVGLEDQCLDSCDCWCHRRCGAPLPLAGGRCYRLAGHGPGYSPAVSRAGHRSRQALRNDARRQARYRAARGMEPRYAA